jgi:hypothetical protein
MNGCTIDGACPPPVLNSLATLVCVPPSNEAPAEAYAFLFAE